VRTADNGSVGRVWSDGPVGLGGEAGADCRRRAVPKVGQIDLGPPVSLFVQARLGLTAEGFKAAAPSIAAALNVAGLTVTPHAGNWVRIVLLTKPPGIAHRAG
jgi:hypothetical protein